MRLLLILVLLPVCLSAQISQPFPQKGINNTLQQAWQTYKSSSVVPISPKHSTANTSGAYQLLQKYRPGHISSPKIPSNSSSGSRSGDTVVVGAAGNDTLVVTGTWQSGPIIVLNSGVLIFKNAYATILGDIYVIQKGQLFASNSTLYLPQQYFYQRAILTDGQASILLKDCTLNFGGLTHNFILLDTSSITVQNVHFTDWTTSGAYGKSVFTIDTCNVIGEIIIIDSSTVSVRNTDTVLFWHHIPKNGGLNWTFPNGVNLSHYSLTPSSPGVTGLKYNIEADNCKLAWWALMPEDGSNVKISNSYLRAIGVWFTGNDSTIVSGLSDNSSYKSPGNLFNDRTLILDTTSVMTWSLYPMEKANVTIQSCIAGEIGSEGTAKTQCLSTFVDGSGGYFWGTDTSFQIAELCGFTSNVRSEGSAFVLIAYSSISNGEAAGIANSVLFLVQTVILQQPIAYDGSDVWVDQISPPANAYVKDSVPIFGSAYILRGPQSQWMSFDHYKLYYQPNGGTTWNSITGNVTSPINQGQLVKWGTMGLTPGNYNLMLTVYDNYNDSVSGSAPINLQPSVLNGIEQVNNTNMVTVYPNPVTKQLSINSKQLSVNSARVCNILGQTVFNCNIPSTDSDINLDVSQLPAGIYFYQLTTTSSQMVTGKFVKE